MNRVKYNGQTGTWTVKASDGTVLCQGEKRKVEDFLDHADYQEYLRQKRIRRRMCKLLNWLYNRRKGR